MDRRPNISTENQPKGSARNISDTLDRDEDIATKAGATEAPPEPEAEELPDHEDRR